MHFPYLLFPENCHGREGAVQCVVCRKPTTLCLRSRDQWLHIVDNSSLLRGRHPGGAQEVDKTVCWCSTGARHGRSSQQRRGFTMFQKHPWQQHEGIWVAALRMMHSYCLIISCCMSQVSLTFLHLSCDSLIRTCKWSSTCTCRST